uniref:Uncharacterized protein n=1 Tax=Oncorhynchus kisutch TaxID=8019 RepID=A0A8C7GYQ6_ONCKI
MAGAIAKGSKSSVSMSLANVSQPASQPARKPKSMVTAADDRMENGILGNALMRVPEEDEEEEEKPKDTNIKSTDNDGKHSELLNYTSSWRLPNYTIWPSGCAYLSDNEAYAVDPSNSFRNFRYGDEVGRLSDLCPSELQVSAVMVKLHPAAMACIVGGSIVNQSLGCFCLTQMNMHCQLGLTPCSDCQYSQAIKHLNNSARVIKSKLAEEHQGVLKAEGPDAAVEEREETVELKDLLTEIQEKVEDATVGQKMAASAAAEAVMQETLAGGSAFPAPSGSSQNGGTFAPMIQVRSTYRNDNTSSPPPSIHTHTHTHLFVPSDFKKAKQETHVNKMEVERYILIVFSTAQVVPVNTMEYLHVLLLDQFEMQLNRSPHSIACTSL